MENSQKATVAAWASTVSSAAFQISLAILNRWLNTHISWLWILPLWGVAAALWVWSFVVRRKPSQTPPVNQKSQTARDVGGHQFQAEKIEFHEASRVQNPATPPPRPEPFPIKFDIQPRFSYVAYSDVVWIESAFPTNRNFAKALVVDYSRNVPPPGMPGRGPIAVVAILKVAHGAGMEQLPRTYWINQRNYEVSFTSGHKETVLLGREEGPVLAFYTNPLFGELAEDQYHLLPYRRCGPKTPIPKSGSITIEVSIHDMGNDETIQQNKFMLQLNGGEMGVKIIA